MIMELDMDFESDLFTNENNHELDTNSFSCETMNIEQTSDVSLLLKRAIGAERRQKSLQQIIIILMNQTTNNSNFHQISETNTFEETEQFIHDLCAELTNTTAALVSSSSTTNALNFSTSSEQTLIH